MVVIFTVNNDTSQNRETNFHASLYFPFASSDQMNRIILWSKMLEISILKIMESKVNRKKACVTFYCIFMEVITRIVFLQL